MSKTPYFELIANKLIEQLTAGTAPFQKPWKAGEMMLPQNPISGTRYRGANVLWLLMQGYTDPRWMTYKQAQSIGAQVRKGEKSTFVQYWKFYEEQTVTDEHGNSVKQRVILERPRTFSARVFNADQIDSLPVLERPEQDWCDLAQEFGKFPVNTETRIVHCKWGGNYRSEAGKVKVMESVYEYLDEAENV